MKLPTGLLPGLGAALGGVAPLFQSSATLAALAGLLYLGDCRSTARSRDAVDSCYFTALTLAGVGIGAKAGFQAGYNTLNPALRRPDDDELLGLLREIATAAAPPPPPDPPEDEAPSGPEPQRQRPQGDLGRSIRGLFNNPR